MRFLLIFLLFSCVQKKENLENLENYGKVPSFSFQSARNELVTNKNFEGKPYFINFIFASCTMSCPMTMTIVKRISSRLKNKKLNANIISLTVDPETDTPTRLTKLKTDHKVHEDNWFFLTGSFDEINNFIIKGLKSPMEKVTNTLGDLIDIVHSNKFILVDSLGNIRGFYDSRDQKEINKLIDGIKLLEEK